MERATAQYPRVRPAVLLDRQDTDENTASGKRKGVTDLLSERRSHQDFVDSLTLRALLWNIKDNLPIGKCNISRGR